MLVSVIRQEFLRNPGKYQRQKNAPRAFKMTFTLTVDCDVEDGYRQLELILYAPGNYVQVWRRETWSVVSEKDLEWDENTLESRLRPGASYQDGASPWEKIGDHDSCYPDSIERCLQEYGQRILCFDSGDWYEVVEPPEGLVDETRSRPDPTAH